MNPPPLPPPTPDAGEDPPLAPPGRGLFGKTVRAFRKSRGLTLEAVAEETGLHPSTLSLIECGKRIPPELADVHELGRILQIGGRQYERFVALAIEERSATKRPRRRRKPGIAVRVRRQVPAPVLPESLDPAAPDEAADEAPDGAPDGAKDAAEDAASAPTPAPAQAVPSPPRRSAILAQLLKSLLDLELTEKIDSVKVFTRTGKEFVIRTRP
jgi:transcriptional regulator with XRE-family HTH domain